MSPYALAESTNHQVPNETHGQQNRQIMGSRYLPPRSAPPRPRAPTWKYSKLALTLAQVDETTITLDFRTLDKIVDGIPPSAYRYRSWWANTRKSPQGTSWMSVAWNVTRIDLENRSVTYTREALPESAEFGPGYAPHWIQVKQASKAVKDWLPGEVRHQSGETIDVRFSTETITFWCRFFRKLTPPRGQAHLVQHQLPHPGCAQRGRKPDVQREDAGRAGGTRTDRT